jgi:hypothetical protein
MAQMSDEDDMEDDVTESGQDEYDTANGLVTVLDMHDIRFGHYRYTIPSHVRSGRVHVHTDEESDMFYITFDTDTSATFVILSYEHGMRLQMEFPTIDEFPRVLIHLANIIGIAFASRLQFIITNTGHYLPCI